MNCPPLALLRIVIWLKRRFVETCFSLFLLILMGFSCFAQDPTFSQYNLNQYYFNPAYTGADGGYHMAVTYRNLWPNVPGRVFPGALSTYYAVADAYFKKGNSYTAGAGIFAMQDVEGEGYLTTSTFGLSYAQHFLKIGSKTDELPRLQLSVGFKAYFNSISVNWDKLVFSDQVNIQQGIAGQSASDHTGIRRKYTADLDAGLLVKNNFRGEDRWYNEFGFALAHILNPSMSLTNSNTDESRIPRKYVASYRSSIALGGRRFYIGPTILFENQKQFYELNTGVDLFINPNPSSEIIPLCFSLLNRWSFMQGAYNTNALIAEVRYKGATGKNKRTVYNIGFSADIPYTGLAIQTKGAYEISLAIIFPSKGSNRFSKCPFGTF